MASSPEAPSQSSSTVFSTLRRTSSVFSTTKRTSTNAEQKRESTHSERPRRSSTPFRSKFSRQTSLTAPPLTCVTCDKLEEDPPLQARCGHVYCHACCSQLIEPYSVITSIFPSCEGCYRLLTGLLDHRAQLQYGKEQYEIQRAASILREEIRSGGVSGNRNAAKARARDILREEKLTDELRREKSKAQFEESCREKLEETCNSAQFTRESVRLSKSSTLTYNSGELEFDAFLSVEHFNNHQDGSSSRHSEPDTISLTSLLRELTKAQEADAVRRNETCPSAITSTFDFSSDDEV
jgi:hypothetical protein